MSAPKEVKKDAPKKKMKKDAPKEMKKDAPKEIKIMDAPKEFLFITYDDDDLTYMLYDWQEERTVDGIAKESCKEKTLCFIGDDYFISAVVRRNFLRAWRLAKKDQQNGISCKCVGTPIAVAVSPDGLYCLYSSRNKIYVHRLNDGELLAVLEHSPNTNKCLKFSHDSRYLFAGGADGVTVAYEFFDIIRVDNKKYEPRYFWHDHLTEITDIFVTVGGIYSRLLTTSMDCCCCMYDLFSGTLFLTVRMDDMLTSVLMDACENFVFLGSMSGDLYRILVHPPQTKEGTDSKNIPRKGTVKAHSAKVTGLAESKSGDVFVSSSDDGQCKLWCLSKFQYLKTIYMSGPVTNVAFFIPPIHMFSSNPPPPEIIVTGFNEQAKANKAAAYKKPLKIRLKNFELTQEQPKEKKNISLKLAAELAAEEEEVALLERKTREMKLKFEKEQEDLYAYNRFLCVNALAEAEAEAETE